MAQVRFEDLEEAFAFVSADPLLTHEAYLSLDTGQIHWTSDGAPLDDEDIPDDLDTSDRYLAIPHKADLDLGKRLALRFALKTLSDERHEQVESIFRHPGAYARFKDLLEREGVLEQWYTWENDAIQEALRGWCADNGIQIAAP
jgi:Uncharacterised protein family (UPF0158)